MATQARRRTSSTRVGARCPTIRGAQAGVLSFGKVGYASESVAELGTRLSEVSVPSLEDINADPQFRGVSLEAEAFEVVWKRYAINGA
jgi:hypothetical protein